MKHDGRHKARLVAGGHRIDTRGYNVIAIIVQGLSLRLMLVIADQQKLNIVSSNVKNTFISSCTKELICTRLGPEFGTFAGKLIRIIK